MDKGHIGHEAKKCAYEYQTDGSILSCIDHHFVSLGKKHFPRCFSRLISPMSARWEHDREGCLFRTSNSSEKIALTMQIERLAERQHIDPADD